MAVGCAEREQRARKKIEEREICYFEIVKNNNWL